MGILCPYVTPRKIEEMIYVCRVMLLPQMAMEHRSGDERLPTSHAQRIELRDAKMWRRET